MARKTNFGKVLTYIITAALVLGVIGFLAHFTNGFTGELTTFYITHNGEDIMSDKPYYEFTFNSENKVEVKYTFDKLMGERKLGYNVQIVPYISKQTDFEYKVGEKYYKYKDVEDLTEYFEIYKEDNYFTVRQSKDLPEILSKMHGAEATDVPNAVGGSNTYFTLIVSSEDGAAEIKVNFTLIEFSLTIDRTEVVI